MLNRCNNFPNNFDSTSLENIFNSFIDAGFKLSENDKFVIEAALLLVQLDGARLSYEETCEYLVKKQKYAK